MTTAQKAFELRTLALKMFTLANEIELEISQNYKVGDLPQAVTQPAKTSAPVDFSQAEISFHKQSIAEIRGIEPNKIYSQGEAKKLLQLHNTALVELCKKRKIVYSQAHPSAYRKFLGSDIIDFLNKTTHGK